MTAEALQLEGRYTIAPDTEILGGVYYRRAAIVVDFAENPAKYEEAYGWLERILDREEDPNSLLPLGHAVSQVTKGMIAFQRLVSGMILKAHAESLGLERLTESHALGLSVFMESGAGSCHHQALLAGSLLRLLQDRRDIGGHVSLEGPEQEDGFGVRHPWIRYTRDDGKLVIDVSENRVLAFRESLPAGLDVYLRPEEVAARADLGTPGPGI